MDIFKTVKANVTTRQAAEYYGLRVRPNGMACCPFHPDKHPSMKLDERYYCFGCHATGDVIDFVANLHGISKLDAALRLAEDFRLEYDKPEPHSRGKPKPPPYAGAAARMADAKYPACLHGMEENSHIYTKRI